MTNGWQITPLTYLENREPEFEGERIQSQYVAVRDGCRLAIDVHLPGGEATDGECFPAICVFTPYYRRFSAVTDHRPDLDLCPTVAFYRDLFVPRGYALVAVDVRGSGASFGCRDGFRSPKERMDHHDVADWVSRQPWCSGTIGATGISYPGAAADFLASTCHPAVKAVAPLCAVWDTWSNHLYPGGVLCTCITQRYGQLADALDYDHRDQIPSYAYFNDPELAGPAPVDEDTDGALLAQALKEHQGNFDMQDFAQQFRYRDAGLSEDPDYTSSLISPYHYASRDSDHGCAYLSASGWMDGHYQTGTIQRFMWLENPAKRLVLGPWDHGARAHASPWASTADKAQNQQQIMGAEVLRFFDHHLMGRAEAGLEDEAPVHYYTMGEERWKAASSWPPPYTPVRFQLSPDNTLSDGSVPKGTIQYQADFDCRTGVSSRYDRLYIRNVETYYPDWDGRDQRMLCFTAPPLDDDTEITGHPEVSITLTSDTKDLTLFVYLEDICPDGRAVYVTEGLLRALHRAPGALGNKFVPTGPEHRFFREDACPLTPGEPATLTFQLAPTSYLFRKGHQIRVSLALADKDHFTLIPAGHPPAIKVQCGGRDGSFVVLPVAS